MGGFGEESGSENLVGDDQKGPDRGENDEADIARCGVVVSPITLAGGSACNCCDER